MPIHDWTRVSAGTFHDFHSGWVVEIRNALNNGVLPPEYYAQAEQVAGDMGPDVPTLAIDEPPEDVETDGGGGTMLALTPPRTQFTSTAEVDEYARKRRTLVIRHSSEDRVVALIEILSPGNKSSRHGMRAIVDKAVRALLQGMHLLMIDLHPPGPRDPQGIHAAVWAEFSDESFTLPSDKPLTLVSYSAGQPRKAFIQPVAVGDVLPDMALFLEPEGHVMVPLEETYQAAWRGIPQRWRRVLEGERD
jgi:Protein of unknown function (DUF4058)